ncbi:restriction endonuclease subunit S [Flavobacterium cheonhonense]|uniref:Restriction endonuclease subunit S n=1 Tax=Flavobacterium cheonhonense TaxID=706185 RepID=A0ABP7T7A8_9FLAO|nr:restriction endonuclease subunit S [Flavobacterium cheonhonense]
MPNNWKTHKLGDIAEIKGGKRLPKGDVLISNITNHPYIRVTDMGTRNIPIEKVQYVPEDVFPKISRYIVNTNDLILSIVGTVGSVSIIDKKLDNASLTENCVKITNLKEVDYLFLYYYLISDIGQFEISKGIVGSTQPKLPIYNINDLEIVLPEKKQEQQSIASILSAIDDKIENNLAINKTLEEMAMALYKHWFVDFGPFQDGEFVESKLGMIPKGWEVKKITELIEVKDGTHDSPKRVEEGHFLITSKHMTGNSIDFSSAYKVSFEDFTKINKRSLVEKGDILMTMIGTVGNFYFVNEEPNYVIKNIGLFKTSKAPELQSYFYSYFKSKIGQEYIKAQMTGSTQQYVTLNTLRNFDIIIPNKQTLTSFNQVTNDYFETIMLNTKENQTLTQLRDTLLPKLISGEVRLKEFKEN